MFASTVLFPHFFPPSEILNLIEISTRLSRKSCSLPHRRGYSQRTTGNSRLTGTFLEEALQCLLGAANFQRDFIRNEKTNAAELLGPPYRNKLLLNVASRHRTLSSQHFNQVIVEAPARTIQDKRPVKPCDISQRVNIPRTNKPGFVTPIQCCLPKSMDVCCSVHPGLCIVKG